MNDDYRDNNQNPPLDAKPETPEAPEAPAPAPTLNIKSLKPGTVVLMEGETDVYELTVHYPEHGIVDVSASDIALRGGAVGQFMYSVCWSQPGTKLNVIQKGWSVVLRFSNGTYQTQPLSSVGVSGVGENGKRWHYDLF